MRRPRQSDVRCPTGKLAWRHRRDAEAVARRSGSAHQVGLWTYRCPQCEQWHLTSRPQRRPAGGERRRQRRGWAA